MDEDKANFVPLQTVKENSDSSPEKEFELQLQAIRELEEDLGEMIYKDCSLADLL